ncbi:hypothetical protein F3Y22_tig00111342pilonHSYRG00268 [Hibiscus syriacus]|uniref:Uncharacterized protein n=1 Tax=Hibiscus syriacus TaxID=106335 RepID=A0A6A2YPC7_HIBSY|nr:hypothetical protein F3Y22_tig00111342pilonHSYRG00268 [Hibiscus syriacus]
MGTEVLWPRDCLIERIRVSPMACSCRRYGNGGFNPGYHGHGRFNKKPIQKKRVGSDQAVSKRSSSNDKLKVVRNNVGIEKVTIFRRGCGNGGFSPSYHGNGRFNKKPVQMKRIGSDHAVSKRSSSNDKLKVVRNNNVGIEKVTILREDKSPAIEKSDVYAGSAFVVSPAPSSVPLPTFSRKKKIPIDNSATRDLRRLLRLDL